MYCINSSGDHFILFSFFSLYLSYHQASRSAILVQIKSYSWWDDSNPKNNFVGKSFYICILRIRYLNKLLWKNSKIQFWQQPRNRSMCAPKHSQKATSGMSCCMPWANKLIIERNSTEGQTNFCWTKLTTLLFDNGKIWKYMHSSRLPWTACTVKEASK